MQSTKSYPYCNPWRMLTSGSGQWTVSWPKKRVNIFSKKTTFHLLPGVSTSQLEVGCWDLSQTLKHLSSLLMPSTGASLPMAACGRMSHWNCASSLIACVIGKPGCHTWAGELLACWALRHHMYFNLCDETASRLNYFKSFNIVFWEWIAQIICMCASMYVFIDIHAYIYILCIYTAWYMYLKKMCFYGCKYFTWKYTMWMWATRFVFRGSSSCTGQRLRRYPAVPPLLTLALVIWFVFPPSPNLTGFRMFWFLLSQS